MNTLEIHDLTQDEIEEIGNAFESIGWANRIATCRKYFNEQSQHSRSVLVARVAGVFCGYVTVKWKSDYSFFIQSNIPEIADLNVLPDFRGKGIGTKLIQACEDRIKHQGYTTVGLGVGLTADYGSAQRLYIQLGFMPDGYGVHHKNKSLNYGDTVLVDDDLVLYLTKKL